MIIQAPMTLGLGMVKAIPIKSVIKNKGKVFGGRGDMLGVVRDGIYIIIERGEQLGLYVTDPEALTVPELQKLCKYYKKEFVKKEVKANLIKLLTNQPIPKAE